MNTVRVMHCADLHLGSKISFLGSASDVLQSEQLLCFERIIDLCKQSETELLIISGDLFDSNNAQDTLIKAVSKMLGRLNGTYIAICAGNHDPLLYGTSPIEKLKIGPNVFVFSEQNPCFEIKEKKLRVYGSSFESVYLNSSDPFARFNTDSSFINIAVLHADLNADTNSNYNPISVSQISKSGMDYVALGHIHKRTEILKAENTFYAYPGCVQGTGFDELGEKGVYIGEISKNKCDLKFVKVAKRQFINLFTEVSSCRTNNEIIDKIREQINSDYPKTAPDNLYKITLVGETDEDFSPDTALVTAALLNDYFYIKVVDSTTTKINLAALCEQNTLKGMFVKRMLDLLEDADDTETLKLALRLGLKAFDGEVKAIDN